MLDSLDHKILNLLQENGRKKRKDLADEIGLSLPSLSERLNKLEDHGIIEGYFTKLNRHTFGYDIQAFILVVMESSKNYKKLLENAKQIPEILECHSVLGEGSHMLKVLVKSTKELESLLSTIQSWPGVVRTITNFVLSTSKETTKIKI
ncbi:MAG: Lrp/AsnC family transcriptional regulator [Ignavibacteria bacterium]|jgi:Lrp/AsnC family leucine-responsive transcriptional regulator